MIERRKVNRPVAYDRRRIQNITYNDTTIIDNSDDDDIADLATGIILGEIMSDSTDFSGGGGDFGGGGASADY